MRFAEIRDRIVNNPGFNRLEEVKRAVPAPVETPQ